MAEAKAYKIIPHYTKDTITYETDELVLCRKCNKSCLEEGKINGFWCRKRKEWHDGDWYCADGERR